MLGLGEVGHIGGHMGVVLNKNIRACNLLHPPPPPNRSLVESYSVYRYFGPFNLCHFFLLYKWGGGKGGGGV